MGFNLRNRDFKTLLDFTPREIRFLLDLSRDLKRAKYGGYEQPRLKGKNIAIIFEKSSTRTRVAFEVAAYDQGAHVTYLGPSGTQIGQKESMKDTARVLGRIFDAIEYRGFGQEIVDELAQFADVPIWNGLTDEFHPTQILADFLTMTEFSDKPLTQISYCYLGDARNNMGDSLLIGGAKLGMDVRLCGPEAPLAATTDLVKQCQADRRATPAPGSPSPTIPRRASRASDFIYTDVWVSMGEDESVWDERVKLLKPYQVNAELIAASGNPHVKFMHCLPAFHDRNTKVGEEMFERFGLDGMEVTNDVFESPARDRLGPGREPDAHDQGRHGRHARRLSEPTDAHRRRPRRQRPAEAGRADDRGAVSGPTSGSRPQALARVADAARAGHLPRQRPAGRAAGAPGRRPTRTSRPTRSTCWAPRRRA